VPERLVEVSTGRPLAARIRWARTFAERSRGLLGTHSLARDAALVIPRARQVHTFGMRYPIDVCFCDAAWRVLRVVRLHPWRVSPWVRGARYAVEMAAGAMVRLGPGDQLSPEDSNERYVPS
jgi:uncharacterized membrane protein (UPF0127 family)